MRRDLISSVLGIVAMTIVLGLAYPLVVTAIAQVAFHGQANGSLIKSDGKVIGSKLIAQDFKRDPRYFQPRPSTATNYSASASAFTNLGPNSKDARDTFKKNLDAYLELEGPYNPGLTAKSVPIDAVTSSASGIDPQISVTNARIQAHRIAKVRRVSLATVDKLVDEHTTGRFIGIFGERGVNVLELNLALNSLES
ncbi:MAG TPA: potassium-transporting ATPase subunit KdpC [Thermoleophilaceae bacterium]|jgi:K+-transporting ATPase ATPase C chain|nr:potassium-transporting ATPase subunit KdpC [Thermoleophilaceae bacterium]